MWVNVLGSLKKKLKFSKGGEQNYTTDIFKTNKVVCINPRPVYELVDLQGRQTNGQFYAVELSPVLIAKCTTYKTDKILKNGARRCILEYLVRWRSYSADVDS